MNSDGLVNEGIQFKAEAEAFDASSGAVLLTNNMQTEGCVGDDLRGQGKDLCQLELTLNGMLVKKVDFKAEAESFDASPFESCFEAA